MENKDVKIVAIVGMCGSGKSTAIEYLTERGIPKVYFGGVILNAIKEAGEEITPENEKKFREGLREKEGKDFVVKRVIESTKKLIEAGQKRIVLDGLYSWTEYKILRQEFPTEMTVVELFAANALQLVQSVHLPRRKLLSVTVARLKTSKKVAQSQSQIIISTTLVLSLNSTKNSAAS